MASKDVTPGLYDKIKNKLTTALENDKKVQSIMTKAENGKATHHDLDLYAKRLGKHTSNAFLDMLTEKNLPEGELFYHIAKGTVGKTMKDNVARVNDLGAQVQESLNKTAGIGLKAVKVKDQTKWNSGLVGEMVQGDLTEARAWMGESVVNACMHYASDFMKTNADFQYKSGLSPLISRDADFGCCEWCADLEGTYEYGSQPEDFYRRHDYCRCTITFDPRRGDGKVQDSWSKEWMSKDEALKREERKTYNAKLTWKVQDGKKVKA